MIQSRLSGIFGHALLISRLARRELELAVFLANTAGKVRSSRAPLRSFSRKFPSRSKRDTRARAFQMQAGGILWCDQHEKQMRRVAVERFKIDALNVTAEGSEDLGDFRQLAVRIAMPSPIAVEPSRSRSASTAVISPDGISGCCLVRQSASSSRTSTLLCPLSDGSIISGVRKSVNFHEVGSGPIGIYVGARRGDQLFALQNAMGVAFCSSSAFLEGFRATFPLPRRAPLASKASAFSYSSLFPHAS